MLLTATGEDGKRKGGSLRLHRGARGLEDSVVLYRGGKVPLVLRPGEGKGGWELMGYGYNTGSKA